MNALITIHSAAIGTDTIPTCNARELHGFLEVGRDFSTWIKDRITEYSFIEGQDFSPILGKSTGGRPTTEYYLSLDMAKEVSMVERNEKGKQARRFDTAKCHSDGTPVTQLKWARSVLPLIQTPPLQQAA